MGKHQWGQGFAGVLLGAAAVVTVSGCSGTPAEADPKPTTQQKVVDLAAATTAYQDAVTQFDSTDGCPKAVGECWDKMTAVMKPARELRTAMNGHQGTGPAFWSEAYALIDTMERGMKAGSDKFTNRPDVLGSAHTLSRWLDAHPVK
ncbi:hypothetical protein GCM10010329_79170 [Streptomyces spiroverticillatus]|uniref:Lipoprotein n=1 Tax=Streptomyces finlayi TaxID=67296 RepID=A0A918X9H6_9ACTN|nr:hypothetical protein [Streptomyces finlayi]GHA44655.1 hypothetical protein GCM10010329_79170 [Streptomyces spiroverticillatus]GHD17904.1 hypothetical protein GCM10010334_80150 [Streptomyces finlayi]